MQMRNKYGNPREYSVLIFATNKLSYLQLAFNCARSVLLFNDISICIVSNLIATIPNDLKKSVKLIPLLSEHTNLGIDIKLHVDKYLQSTYTLLIDSDCICYDSLDKVFDACAGMHVAVAGNIVPAESWCGKEQASTIKQHFGLDQLIRYNGGLYFFKKSGLTESIFEKAREIAEKYDEYGFTRIQNKWINEEGPISIAMMLNGQKPLADDGRYMTDLFTDHRPLLNVLKGKRLLKNQPEFAARHRPWYTSQYAPVILHFGGTSLNTYPYNSQIILLKLNNLKLPVWLSTALVNTFINTPYKLYYSLSKKIRDYAQG